MKEYITEHFTGANGIAGVIAASLGSTLAWCFGEWELGLKILITCMVADYLMGLLCGRKEKNLSSEVGFNGLKKKFTVLIVLMLAVMVDRLLGQGWVFRTLVIYFYIGIEGLSLLENAARLNVPIPDKIKEALVQLKEGNKKDISKEEK